MIGKTINNYLIESKLGDGGMGEVYYARHNKVDREVAIKILHSHLFQNESIHNRFKNEANALIKLNHPNIVKIYDYVEQDNMACLIMEYINGYTLDTYITKYSGPLSSERAVSVMCGILDAVQYAHDNNILHRDIKPGNIMITKDGTRVRIMDFGIAKLTDSKNFKTTHAGTQLGTPFYMSPEQIKGIQYSKLSDIYSLGVTLFEMVTGKCPYHDVHSLFELQSKIVNEPLPLTIKFYPNVSLKIQNAISKATLKSPEQRFQSCEEFRLNIIEGNSTIIVPGNYESIPVGRKKKKVNSNTYVLAGLAFVAVISIFSLMVSNKPKITDDKLSKQVTEDTISSNKTASIIVEKKVTPVPDSNAYLIKDYIEKKQEESKIYLPEFKINKLIEEVKIKPTILSSGELSNLIDSYFAIKYPTDIQIQNDFRSKVKVLPDVCTVMLDSYDRQIKIVTINKDECKKNNPPTQWVVKVLFKICDSVDTTDVNDCIKTLIYTRSGNNYVFTKIL